MKLLNLMGILLFIYSCAALKGIEYNPLRGEKENFGTMLKNKKYKEAMGLSKTVREGNESHHTIRRWHEDKDDMAARYVEDLLDDGHIDEATKLVSMLSNEPGKYVAKEKWEKVAKYMGPINGRLRSRLNDLKVGDRGFTVFGGN